MTRTVIHFSASYQVVSLGNGTAYELIDMTNSKSILFQGADADLFRDEYDAQPDEVSLHRLFSFYL